MFFKRLVMSPGAATGAPTTSLQALANAAVATTRVTSQLPITPISAAQQQQQQRIPTVVTPTGLKITPVPGSAVTGRAAIVAAAQAQQQLPNQLTPNLIRATSVVTKSQVGPIF